MSMKRQRQSSQSEFDGNTILKKSFLVQKFINFLIIIRMYVTQVPLYIWTVVLVVLYGLKLRRQGNIPSSILVLLAMLCSVLGQLAEVDFVFFMAPILAGISHFFSYKTYCFPRVNVPVGMRQQILQNDLYLVEFYPIKRNQNLKKRVIHWNHRLEFNKILQHEKAQNLIYRALFMFVTSAIQKFKIILADGDEEMTNQAIVFSHGRTAAPFHYSQILTKLMSFQNHKFDIFSVQHTQKKEIGQVETAKVKRYRQLQVQARAAQMYSAIQHCKDKKGIMLMGHSYGGSTVIQTYHSLSPQLRQKVSHIVLLDPWFFPLTQAKLSHEIHCPILVLANQYFLQNQDIYHRNKDFLNAHKKGKVIQLVWKKGDHLHQTDFGFIFGNIFNKIKHPELGIQMLNKNVEAIRLFIQDKNINQSKMRQIFTADILPPNYKPQKWNNYLNL